MGVIGPKPNCEVHRHAFSINFTQESGNQDKTYFSDFTENHYKAMVNVEIISIIGTIPNLLQVVVTDRNGVEEAIDIPFFTSAPGAFSGQVVVQVEDARSISIRFTANFPALATGRLDVVKDFCICCV